MPAKIFREGLEISSGPNPTGACVFVGEKKFRSTYSKLGKETLIEPSLSSVIMPVPFKLMGSLGPPQALSHCRGIDKKDAGLLARFRRNFFCQTLSPITRIFFCNRPTEKDASKSETGSSPGAWTFPKIKTSLRPLGIPSSRYSSSPVLFFVRDQPVVSLKIDAGFFRSKKTRGDTTNLCFPSLE